MRNITILSLLGCLSCIQATTIPKPGDKYLLPDKFGFLIAAANLELPCAVSVIDHVKYDVAIGADGNVFYVGTNDPNFRTKEGLSISSTLQDVLATGAKPLTKEDGWAFYTALSSGWSVAFITGVERTNGIIQPKSKIAWFFKRK